MSIYFMQESGRCEDIKWHFIGHLQRNKVNNLCSMYHTFVITFLFHFTIYLNDSMVACFTFHEPAHFAGYNLESSQVI